MNKCACGSCNIEVMIKYSQIPSTVTEFETVEVSYHQCQVCGLEFMDAEQVSKMVEHKRKAKTIAKGNIPV